MGQIGIWLPTEAVSTQVRVVISVKYWAPKYGAYCNYGHLLTGKYDQIVAAVS